MPPDKPLNDSLDEELEDTFPASDPPGLTEPHGQARRRQKAEEAERDPRPPTKH